MVTKDFTEKHFLSFHLALSKTSGCCMNRSVACRSSFEDEYIFMCYDL